MQDLAFDAPKTKTAAEVLDTLELGGKVLLVLPSPSDSGAVEKSFRNIGASGSPMRGAWASTR